MELTEEIKMLKEGFETDLDPNYNRRNSIHTNDSMEDSERAQTEERLLPETTLPSSSEGSLVVYKSCFLSLMGAKAVINCFLPLYFKQIGLNPAQIGSIMFLKPIGGFLSGSSISYLTKIFKNQIRLLHIIICFYIVCGLSIGFLQTSPLSEVCPAQNVTTDAANTSVKISYTDFENQDRSWLFNTDKQWSLVLCLCLLVFSLDFFLVVLDTLVHSITITNLGKDNIRSYGIVRAWGAVGYGSLSLITGLVISATVSTSKICGNELHLADYHYMFYVFASIAWIFLLNIGNIDKDKDVEVHGVRSVGLLTDGFQQAIYNVRVLSWVAMLLSRSVFYAVTQGILNWHLENIGASPALIGACNFVTTTTEFFVFNITPNLIKRFGEFKLASIGIMSYVLRFFLFSIITNPIYIIPVEIFEGTMYAILWSSTVTFLSSQVNEKEQTQLQGLLQATVMLGTGLGLLLSGQLTQIFGTSVMFAIFSAIAAVSSFAFVSVQLWSYKHS